jgi:hypothetical protein
MNESQTKHDFIDPALKEAGWGVVEGSRIRLEFPITRGRLIGQGRRSKPLFADYVLQYKNRNMAVSLMMPSSQIYSGFNHTYTKISRLKNERKSTTQIPGL